MPSEQYTCSVVPATLPLRSQVSLRSGTPAAPRADTAVAAASCVWRPAIGTADADGDADAADIADAADVAASDA